MSDEYPQKPYSGNNYAQRGSVQGQYPISMDMKTSGSNKYTSRIHVTNNTNLLGKKRCSWDNLETTKYSKAITKKMNLSK